MDKLKRSIKQDDYMEAEMNWPKVTICVPVRNGARTIQRTLDSILAQDYPNYEIIVSDNCSDDDTAKIVRQYDSNVVKYFFNPVLEKWGAESNWNHILSLARGPFIALYHADDLYTSTMVSRQVEFLLNHPKSSAVFTKTQTIDEFDRPIRNGFICLPKELKDQEEFDFPDLLNAVFKHGNFLTVPTMMARRESLDKAGLFDLKFCTAADIDLWLRLSRLGTVGIINEPLHKYRISENQGSAQLFKFRTYRSHCLQVMDHYLSIPEFRQLVKPQAFRYYEMYSVFDDINRAINMFYLGNVADARLLMKSALSRPEFRKGLLTKNFAKQFFLSLPVFLIIQLGWRKLLYSLYEKHYKPWRRYGKLRLFRKEKI
jgi:glycosyltransferase involved in cell wall biosynthesis